jgi:hypothetical protein
MNRKVIPNEGKQDLIVFEGKLKYASKAGLESALISRGILNNDGTIPKDTHGVVYLGFITIEPETDTTNAVISTKYHADIMTETEFHFGANEVVLADGANQAHSFG